LLKYWYIHEPIPVAAVCGSLLMGLWVRTRPGSRMPVSFERLRCQVEVSATGRSVV